MNMMLRALGLSAGIAMTLACQTGEKPTDKEGMAKTATMSSPSGVMVASTESATTMTAATAKPAEAAAPAASDAPKSATPVSDAVASGNTSSLQGRLDRSVNGIMERLKLEDPAKATRAREILNEYYLHMWAWHEKADEKLNPLWEAWAAARNESPRDVAKVDGIVNQMREVYVDFKPFKDDFEKKLSSEISPEALLAAKDYMTRANGTERTYGVYIQIVPELNDAQKKFVHDEMVAAREEAMQAHAENEKKNWFKVHKDTSEAYVTKLGYDWRTHYREFVARTDPNSEAAKSAAAAKAANGAAPAAK